MNEVIVSMNNISKSFPGVKALDHVKFELRSGEVMANHSIEKYSEALRLYTTTTESIKSLARRFGFNDCSFGQFIRRHFPEAVEKHNELIRKEKTQKPL